VVPAPKLLIIVNDLPFFISHRLAIAVAARDAGYEVVVAAPAHQHSDTLAAQHIEFVELLMPRKRGSLGAELASIRGLWRLLGEQQPDVAHLITAKPIIFGGIACRFRGIPVVAAISGLGHVFILDNLRARLARKLLLLGYRLALKRRQALAIFQNRDNQKVFEKAGIIKDHFVLIRGSGADLAAFNPVPCNNVAPVVVLPARMLWTKGVGEFVEAARILRTRGYDASFILVGNNDPGNPANIEQSQLDTWNAEGAVQWLGYRADIAKTLEQADIVALPSYLEGLPKTLIDAAAAGRPSVTCDVPGCRDAIEAGVTGLLCEARSAESLANAIAVLLDDRELRERMGREARKLAEREFDIRQVISQHLACYRNVRACVGSHEHG
jgi:glycosyltransferase involved in cell wall biosynthesis